MPDSKRNTKREDKKGNPTIDNDQIGENAGEGRFIKEATKDNKKRKS